MFLLINVRLKRKEQFVYIYQQVNFIRGTTTPAIFTIYLINLKHFVYIYIYTLAYCLFVQGQFESLRCCLREILSTRQVLWTEANTAQSAPRILSTLLIVYMTVAKKCIDRSVSGIFISAGHSPPQIRYRTVRSRRNKMQMDGIVGGNGKARWDIRK